MNSHTSRFQFVTMYFAELLDEVGKRLHVGCIMAAGEDWVEVSAPPVTHFKDRTFIRFCPSHIIHQVCEKWRAVDRVGFIYANGGPPPDQFTAIPGLYDPRPASLRAQDK